VPAESVLTVCIIAQMEAEIFRFYEMRQRSYEHLQMYMRME